MNDQAEAVMTAVFGEGYEWWSPSSREMVVAAADRLLRQGLSIGAAADIVGTITKAIQSEFGG